MPINNSVRASQAALEAIILPKMKKKGWTKHAPIWANQADVSVSVLKKFWQGKSIREDNFQGICKAVGVENWQLIVESNSQHHDWGEAPDVPVFFGRDAELEILKKWVLDDRCRLVAIIGMGGVGKTAVSIKLGKGGIGKTDLSLQLARGIQNEFEFVIWRSLINAPPASEMIADLVQFFSLQQVTQLPETLNKQISLLLEYLKTHRCLLMFDNVETILQGGSSAGKYQPGYQDYGQLLEKIASVPHQSCLLLTSREKIKNLERLEGKLKPVRFLQLQGLNPSEGQHIFEAIADFSGSDQDWESLVEFYNGNPLALELAAHHIKDAFAGNITAFLAEGKPVFSDLRELLDWHFFRFSADEREILYWLVIYREATTISDLKADLVSRTAKDQVSETLRSLQTKLLLEKSDNGERFTLQPVLMEDITARFIERVCQEIETGEFERFNDHALIQGQAKDYIRTSQTRTFLEPIKQHLLEKFKTQENLENHLKSVLLKFQQNHPLKPGYTGSNFINLFCYLNTPLNGYNFSNLTLWQANLQGLELQNVNFSNCDLTQCVFTRAFGGIHALAFSPDGQQLAVGDSNGLIHLLRMEDGQQIATFQKHGWWTVCVDFSPDGEKLVSSSIDGTLKIWDVKTRQCLHDLKGHKNWIWTVAFHPHQPIIASGSNDQTIKLWDVNTGECLTTLEAHQGWVLGVDFSPDGQILASGSYDKTIKLWDVKTWKCFQTFHGHKDAIWCVAFHPKGETLASCGYEKTIRLWDIETGECEQILRGHKKEIKVLAFSSDGKTLASGCFEPRVKFWDVETGKCRGTGTGHQSGIRTLAFHRDQKTVATGDNDEIIKFWDAQTGKCIKTFQGHTPCIWSVAISPDGKKIASSHLDHSIRLWNFTTGKSLKTLRGHQALIWSVAFSPNCQLLASSSDDETIRIWNLKTGLCWKQLQYLTDKYQGGIWTVAFSPCGQFLASGGQDTTVKIWDINTGYFKVLEGHQSWIWTVAFSSNRKILASGSDDQTIKIWDFQTRKCLQTLKGHRNNIRSISFSPDGNFLVSSSEDTTLKLWDLRIGKCLKTLRGHESLVWPVKFSTNGQFIISGSHDRTLKLWDGYTGDYLKTLQGHTDQVTAIAVSLDSQIIISSSLDGTLKFWNIETGDGLKTLRVPRPYEEMNITGIKGLTPDQKEILKALGAVENLAK